MTDDDLHATIDRHRKRCPEAANDLIRFAAEIDLQRATANQLADITQRLRALAEGRRKALEHIKEYAEKVGVNLSGHCQKDLAIGGHCQHALGTVANMVQQCFDSEKANDPSE